ncbi:MAG: hypothetical protein WCB12_17430 [Bryobacteraceae bacterium]|jgi:hypothetical protein
MLKDGRDVYDNIQLIYRYPNGQKLTYSSISTNQFLPYFNGTQPEMGEIIMGTDGTIEITVGDDVPMPVAWVVSRAAQVLDHREGQCQEAALRGRSHHGCFRRPDFADDRRPDFRREGELPRT